MAGCGAGVGTATGAASGAVAISVSVPLPIGGPTVLFISSPVVNPRIPRMQLLNTDRHGGAPIRADTARGDLRLDFVRDDSLETCRLD